MRLFAILPTLLLAAPVTAQTVRPGDVVSLSTFSPPGAAHGELALAMNSVGDAYAVWEAAVDAPGQPGGDQTRIEGAFLRRISATTWRVFPTEILAEADSAVLGAAQVYSGGDSCSAPDIAALDNHFVVVWSRADAAGAPEARLESCSIEVPATGAALVHAASPGVGHALAAFNPSGAAGHADLAVASASDAVVVWVTNVGSTQQTASVDYDFELRAAELDYPLISSAPVFGTEAVLDALLAYDEMPGGTSHAAAVEPSAVFDSYGRLVVAYGDYRSAERLGFGLNQRGKMEVIRVQGGGAFGPVNATFLQHRSVSNLQRSAHLYRSPNNTDLSLCFIDDDVAGPAQNEIAHVDLEYPGPASAATIQDHGVGLTSWNPSQAEALQHRGARIALADLDYFGTAAAAYKKAGKGWKAINKMTPLAPQGLVFGHLETDSLDPARGWIVVGTRDTSGADPRVSLLFSKL